MIWLGKVEYKKSLELQKKNVLLLQNDFLEEGSSKKNFKIIGQVLGLEHHRVITLGRRTESSDILEEKLCGQNFPMMRVNRGGRATVHSPGQLVVYPVLAFEKMGLKPREFTEVLIESMISFLGVLKIQSYFQKDSPGIYTSYGKIGFLGCHFSKGISSHGFSLNVSNDLDDFSMIKICGQDSVKLDRVCNHISESSHLDLKDLFYLWYEEFKKCVEKKLSS